MSDNLQSAYVRDLEDQLGKIAKQFGCRRFEVVASTEALLRLLERQAGEIARLKTKLGLGVERS